MPRRYFGAESGTAASAGNDKQISPEEPDVKGRQLLPQ